MNKVSYSTRSSLVLSLLGAGVLLTACGGGSGVILPPDGGDVASSSASAGGAGGGAAASTTGSGGTGGATAGTGGAGGMAAPTLTWVTKLDGSLTALQLPEGLAMNAAGDTAYVTLAPTGKVLKINIADGKTSDFGSVPAPPTQKGFALGIVNDKAGDFYVAVASFSAAYQPGIFKIPAAGGAATLFAKDPGMTFPNGMVFNATGDMFVTDSASGSIFKITAAGVVTKWFTDPLLTGDIASACPSGLGAPLGANGIVQSGTDFYVTNTDKASMTKIAIKADGTAGAATTFVATDCAKFGGPDGLSLDSDGTFVVASNGLNAITRVGTDGKVSVIVAKSATEPLDSPASTWITTNKSGKTLFITNSGISTLLTGGTPKPGLLSYPLGG